MNFIDHSKIEGSHAFLSASNYHWLNYDLNKLTESYYNNKAKALGTELHEFASQCINKKIKLKKKDTLGLFVNDCIDKGMYSEKMLYYSDFCYGTADAILYKDGILNIYDLKTGKTKASFKQLEIYCALYCLEYLVDPNDIKFHLRIYQNNGIIKYKPKPSLIIDIMNKIRMFNEHLTKIEQEGMSILL